MFRLVADTCLQAEIRIVERPVSFDRIYPHSFFDGDRKDFHTFEHTSAEARQFADNQGVVFLEVFRVGIIADDV